MTLALRLTGWVALATTLALLAILVTHGLDPRFAPVMHGGGPLWALARGVSAHGDRALAACLSGLLFLALTMQRRAIAGALVAAGLTFSLVAIVAAIVAASAGHHGDDGPVLLGTVGSPTLASSFPCGEVRRQAAPAGEVTTRFTCGLRDGERALQQVDVLALHPHAAPAGSILEIARVCTAKINGDVACQWRGAPPGSALGDGGSWIPGGLVDATSFGDGIGGSEALAVYELPSFALVSVAAQDGQAHLLDPATGSLLEGELLEGHRRWVRPLGASSLFLATASALAAALLLRLREQRRRRWRSLEAARGGTVVGDQVTFDDQGSAQLVGARHDGPLHGEVTLLEGRETPGAYRGAALIDSRAFLRGRPAALAARERRRVAILGTSVIAVIAVGVVPVGLAWSRAQDRLEPLAQAPVAEPPHAVALATACPADMAFLEGGNFSTTGGQGARGERHERGAWVGAFCLDRTEVTSRDFNACVASGRCAEPDIPAERTDCLLHHAGDEAYPVTCLLVAEADTYCRSVGRRLPTDDEWMFAARGRANRRYPWGDEAPDATRVDMHEAGVRGHLLPVGRFPRGATPEGIVDLQGNASEMTSDWVPVGGSIVRGSDYRATSVDNDSETRFLEPRDDGIGFRCAT